MENMETEISLWNPKKWRIENGYTGPEWEMYIDNMKKRRTIIAVITYSIGIIMGTLIGLSM